MEPRSAEIKFGEQTFLSARRRSASADRNVCAPFVTYAVEIEGEAPLIAIAEAVDD